MNTLPADTIELISEAGVDWVYDLAGTGVTGILNGGCSVDKIHTHLKKNICIYCDDKL